MQRTDTSPPAPSRPRGCMTTREDPLNPYMHGSKMTAHVLSRKKRNGVVSIPKVIWIEFEVIYTEGNFNFEGQIPLRLLRIFCFRITLTLAVLQDRSLFFRTWSQLEFSTEKKVSLFWSFYRIRRILPEHFSPWHHICGSVHHWFCA